MKSRVISAEQDDGTGTIQRSAPAYNLQFWFLWQPTSSKPHSTPVPVLLLLLSVLCHAQGTPIIDIWIRVKCMHHTYEHHTHMYQDQGSRIIDTCIMHHGYMYQDQGSYIYASYAHASNIHAKGSPQNAFLEKVGLLAQLADPPPLPVSWAAQKRKKSLMFILHFRLF